MPQQSLTMQDGTALDPKVVKVMRAIRTVEGGNYEDRSGDSGSSAGAYQWNNGKVALKPGEIPVNFREGAMAHGLDPNDFSKANQNKVAYKQIEAMKNEGLQPDEIAAKWNGAKRNPATGKLTYVNPDYGTKFRKALMAGAGASQGYNPTPYSNPTEKSPKFPTVEEQAPETKQNDVLGGIAKGAMGIVNTIEKPFVSAAAKPVQYLAKALGQPDPYASGIPAAGGSITPTTATLEHTAGDLAQVGSYFVPGSGVLGAAGMGALQGAGSAMSEGGNLTDVATQGATGAALGGVLAGGTKLAGGLLQSAGGLLNGEVQQKAVQGIKDAYSSALNLNAAQRRFEGRSGKDLAQVLMEHKAPLSVNPVDSTLDASKALPVLQKALSPLNEQANILVQHPQGVVKTISLSDEMNNLVEKIKGKNLDPLEEESAVKHAQNLFSAAARRYGKNDLIPAEAEQLKQSLQGSAFKGKLTSTDMLQNNINYLGSDVMKNAVEKSIDATDAGVSYKALNKQRSNLIDAIKRLSSLDGVQKVKGGTLGHLMAGTVGAIAGAASGAGPLGAIAGDYFGTKAAQFLQNPETKIGIANAKEQLAGKVPGLLGQAAKPIGNMISTTGKVMKKSARAAGLLGNTLTK
jgi:hypothetical protein